MAKARPASERPLSPHLQVYRPYLTMVLSISHRFTGAALAGSLLLLTWWLAAMASGPESFGFIDGILDSIFGGLILFVLSAVLFYHMGNGIRHLYWDTGRGLGKEQARQSGIAVLIFTAAATLLLWLILLIVA